MRYIYMRYNMKVHEVSRRFRRRAVGVNLVKRGTFVTVTTLYYLIRADHQKSRKATIAPTAEPP